MEDGGCVDEGVDCGEGVGAAVVEAADGVDGFFGVFEAVTAHGDGGW